MIDEVSASKDSHYSSRSAAGNDNNGYSNNDSIKNKFGLGTEAEAWDNESYSDDEDDDSGDGEC